MSNFAKSFSGLRRLASSNIRSLAQGAIRGSPPADPGGYAQVSAVTRLAAPYKRAALSPPIWRAYVIQLIVLLLLALIGAYLVWVKTDWTFKVVIALCLLAAAAVAFWKLFFVKLPDPISEQRYINADARLEDVGDPKSGVSVIGLIASMIAMLVDGSFLGSALVPHFENTLTPQMLLAFQVLVSLSVSLALGWVVYLAAKEAAAAARKTLMRALLSSQSPDDKQRGLVMSRRLEHVLGRDVTKRVPVVARVSLVLLVVALLSVHTYARLSKPPVDDQVLLVHASAFGALAGSGDVGDAGDIALPDVPLPPMDPASDAPVPAPTEVTEPQHVEHGPIVLSITLAVLLIATVYILFRKLKDSMLLSKDAAESALIMSRFTTLEERNAFYEQHRDGLEAMLQQDLAVFGDELAKALEDGDPLVAQQWPPYKAPNAAQLLA